jgi:Kae1-associated kinase Bud32
MLFLIKCGRALKLFFELIQTTSIVDYCNRKAIAKHRFKKTYRHPDLDATLTNQRLMQESRTLHRLKNLGLNVPTLYLVDKNTNTIYMEYIAVQLC